MNDFQRVESLFELGADLDPAARDALLAEQCADRPDLADKVRNMWKFDDAPDFDFEEMPEPDQLLIPESIGPYKIQGLLGHGGMGAVYKAEQEHPKRLVALKVMHMGLASPEYLHRFMAEQKALALMAHPNIAVVYDAGFTADNSPYFAMEYLDGKSLTEWCDDQRLNVRRRLALFLRVCDGVSHAHQKGVVHRDLHPGNLIVISQDGEAAPKIIDFGIAKLEGPDQEEGYRTRLGTVMGTPEFMSPEQASGQAVESGDTRSDVYALGSVLYKLLVGVTPLGDALKDTTITQMVRIIQEGIITRPSARIGDDWDVFAERRACDAAYLRQTLQGDLDWIVMKALERDPERRYGSVADFSRDLEYYLNGFPVSARPPSRIYLMRKFVSRNRYVVGAAGVFLLMLIAGLTTTSIALVRSLEAEDQAQRSLNRLETVNDFYLDIFRSADPYREGKDMTGVELLSKAAENVSDRYKNDPDLEVQTRMALGRSFYGLGSIRDAIDQFELAVSIGEDRLGSSHSDLLSAKVFLAFLLLTTEGDIKRAESLYQNAYQICLDTFGKDHSETLKVASRLCEIMNKKGLHKEALSSVVPILSKQKEKLAKNSEDLLATRQIYGNALLGVGRYSEAESVFKDLYEDYSRVFGDGNPVSLGALQKIAQTYHKTGRLKLAEEIYFQILKKQEDYSDHSHHNVLGAANNYATVISDQGRYVEAIGILLDALSSRSDSIPNRHPSVLATRSNLGHNYMMAGFYEDADRVLRDVLKDKAAVFGEKHVSTLITRWTIGENLAKKGELDLAIPMLENVLDETLSVYGEDYQLAHTFKNILLEIRK